MTIIWLLLGFVAHILQEHLWKTLQNPAFRLFAVCGSEESCFHKFAKLGTLIAFKKQVGLLDHLHLKIFKQFHIRFRKTEAGIRPCSCPNVRKRPQIQAPQSFWYNLY